MTNNMSNFGLRASLGTTVKFNGRVKTCLLNSLELEIVDSVGLISTAKEMWESIKEMFSND
ncbi:hypothetical protein Gotri_014596, partial [Gossypium trilobum]|nr:hypothetical protein [Gossypium trilobum]